MNDAGPPGAANNGFNENLSLFQQGKCGMWIDATVAASFVTDPENSTVADKVSFAQFPNKEGMDNHGNWLWAWSLAIPASSQKQDAAKQFIAWATSKGYTELVASKDGWRAAPPGTRTSLYENADYQSEAPFAAMTLQAINAANTQKSSVQDIPYTGGQFVAIPEFQGIGTAVGQQFSAALAGRRAERGSGQHHARNDPRGIHQVSHATASPGIVRATPYGGSARAGRPAAVGGGHTPWRPAKPRALRG